MSTVINLLDPADADRGDWDGDGYTEAEKEVILNRRLQQDWEDYLRTIIDWSETEEDLYAN